jgi:predicted nucleic acid-binding Zn ribbon protein
VVISLSLSSLYAPPSHLSLSLLFVCTTKSFFPLSLSLSRSSLYAPPSHLADGSADSVGRPLHHHVISSGACISTKSLAGDRGMGALASGAWRHRMMMMMIMLLLMMMMMMMMMMMWL